MTEPTGPRPVADAAALARAPRLIAVDVDGTLLTSEHVITEAARAEIARVRAAGVEVLLASSRGPAALAPVLRRAGLLSPAAFVASQGGLTGRLSQDGSIEAIDQRPMPVEAARTVAAAAVAEGLAVSWYSGARWLVSHVDPTIAREARIVEVEPVVADLGLEAVGPEKIMLVAPTADLGPLRRIAAALPAGLRAQVSNPTYLEITRDDVDKADAVRDYCASAAIAPADVVAIGDGPNDLGLFALAGAAVAPASARAEVLAAADFVTRTNDDDGVAHALRMLVP